MRAGLRSLLLRPLLLREPDRPAGGSLLLRDGTGRVVGGHTLRVPPGPAPA